jgi:hypothetical protein
MKSNWKVYNTATILGLLLNGTMAMADIIPRRGPHGGVKVMKCAEVDADATGNAADPAKVGEFLRNAAYKAASTPEITKLENGRFQVCAIFTR